MRQFGATTMAAVTSSFLDKVLGRFIGRLDTEGLQTVVQRLARERKFLEILFNAIEDGVVVIDGDGVVKRKCQVVAAPPPGARVISAMSIKHS